MKVRKWQKMGIDNKRKTFFEEQEMGENGEGKIYKRDKDEKMAGNDTK